MKKKEYKINASLRNGRGAKADIINESGSDGGFFCAPSSLK